MTEHLPRASMAQTPAHPVPQLQGPFEESMLESIQDDPDADIYLDPVIRRNTLLESATYTRVVAGRWKQKPGERFHPLWKLIAQISFGVHLLAEGMAKSEDEVMQILQAHVDEIDGFLERTTEDFDLAQDDIQERLRCLKLPLSHPATFEKMLEDRNFRLSIVEGNEKIEHIVERTSQATKDSLKDVQKGFDSTSCLEIYLRQLSHTWIRQSVEHEAVFVAMLGNVEGWRKAFMELHGQGGKLGGSLKKLTDIINEMQARAGEVSRRLLHQARGYSGSRDPRSHNSQVMGRPAAVRNTPTSRFQTVPNKQLPTMPDRPPLRQTISNDTVRSQSSFRTNPSQENLRQPMVSHSPPLHNGVPAARQVKQGLSPKVIQIGATSSVRVTSVVPSLVESIPSPRGPPSNDPSQLHSRTIDEEEQPERYFPPVELPAHVPEETMRQVPMSKQNRLSLGLGLIQSNRSEKRSSKLGAPAAALVELLRKPSSHRSSLLSHTPTSSSSPQASRRQSVTASGMVPDKSASPSLYGSTPDVSTNNGNFSSSFSKNNVRRPKKGAQHWFDAHEDDDNDDDKFSVQESGTPQITTLTVQTFRTPGMDHEILPGTPSWAKTSFVQVDKKRADLKKGAFSSHPPDLPPGSPPLGNEPKFTNPLSVVAPQRTPSHASSSGTLGEPGPAFTPSEAGSIKKPNGVKDHQDWKRASAAAPEVVISHNAPPMPPPPKQFVAEMEGSTPVAALPQTTRTFAMELEAPQQYFKLPPRPQPSTQSPHSISNEVAELGKKDGEPDILPQQYFKLPPRPEVSNAVKTPVEEQIQATPEESANVVPKAVENKTSPSMDVEEANDETKSRRTSVADVPPGKKSEGLSITVEPRSQNDTWLYSRREYLATPMIPLPPSPLANDVEESATHKEEPSSTTDTLFLLPAVAYKMPASPRLNLERAETPVETVSQTIERSPNSHGSEPDAEAHSEPSPPVVQQVRPVPTLAAPKATDPVLSRVGGRQLQRDTRPTELKHTRNTSSHGSQNGWKAFFTGQPSPVGSNLSIRSIRRESAIGAASPTLQVPESGSSRFPSSPVATSAKDIVWFNKPFDDMKPLSKVASAPSPAKDSSGDGLGIQMLGAKGEIQKQAVRAA